MEGWSVLFLDSYSLVPFCLRSSFFLITLAPKKMTFKELSKYLEKLEATSSRIDITKILAELFKKSDADEIKEIVYLILGQLAPKYESVVFNLADRMMIQVLARAYKKEIKEVQRLYREMGDIGSIAGKLSNNRGGNLSVTQVFDSLHEIAKMEGEGSQDQKIEATAKLLSKLDSLSAKFVARIPIGKLRLGFSDITIIDALSWMLTGSKEKSEEIKTIYNSTPDVGALASQIKKSGIKKMINTSPVVGIPVLPMLAQRLKSPAEMVIKMGKVAVEPKLDGLRLLVHYKSGSGGFTKAFTRNLNETSWMFPELDAIDEYINAKEVILDTEAIGLDSKTKKLANFQTTMTRRRKHGIKEKQSVVSIVFYIFDILFKDGENLMIKSYLDRRKALSNIIKKGNVFSVVDSVITDDPKMISKINKEKKSLGFEGIMVKKTDSQYVPGRTGWRWVKMKEAETDHAKLADTIDCIVMGYMMGKGKRAEFGIGKILVGVRDGQKIRTLSKVGTGLTDAVFKEMKNRLDKLKTDEPAKEYEVDKDLRPDVWVNPKLVVEVAADEITKSTKHSLGISLRFPKFIRFRDDKNSSSATSANEMKKLYKLQ